MSNESILRKGRGAVPGALDRVAANPDNNDITDIGVPAKKSESEGANRSKVIPGAGPWIEGGYSKEKTPNPTAGVAGSEFGLHVIKETAAKVGEWVKKAVTPEPSTKKIKVEKAGVTGFGSYIKKSEKAIETDE